MSDKCAHCRKVLHLSTSAVNRAKKKGARLFCDRRCAGLGRRKHKAKAQKIAEKRAYDLQYRADNLAMLKAKKIAYHQRTYDPVKAAKVRKKRMSQHVEYCRQPAYVAKKKKYDLQRRADEFGPFAESYLILLELKREINSRTTDEERRITNGTYNKSQFRRRDYQRFVGNQPQGCSVGHA